MNDRIPDQRMPKWWDKWVNPTTVFALIGGIVWGVQLNIYTTALGERTATLEAESTRVEKRMDESDIALAKTVFILDGLVDKVKKFEDREEARSASDELWKQRIIKNEYDIELQKE